MGKKISYPVSTILDTINYSKNSALSEIARTVREFTQTQFDQTGRFQPVNIVVISNLEHRVDYPSGGYRTSPAGDVVFATSPDMNAISQGVRVYPEHTASIHQTLETTTGSGWSPSNTLRGTDIVPIGRVIKNYP